MRELATQKTAGDEPVMPCFDLNFCPPAPLRLPCRELNADRFREGKRVDSGGSGVIQL